MRTVLALLALLVQKYTNSGHRRNAVRVWCSCDLALLALLEQKVQNSGLAHSSRVPPLDPRETLSTFVLVKQVKQVKQVQ